MKPHGGGISVTLENWKYGLVGGLVAMPLTIGHYWASGPRTFPITMVFFGGLVAGYLAKTNSTRESRHGIVAGLVGALPGVLWFLPALRDVYVNWLAADGLVLVLVVTPLVLLVVFGGAALLGLVGSVVGGWLTTKLGARESSTSG